MLLNFLHSSKSFICCTAFKPKYLPLCVLYFLVLSTDLRCDEGFWMYIILSSKPLLHPWLANTVKKVRLKCNIRNNDICSLILSCPDIFSFAIFSFFSFFFFFFFFFLYFLFSTANSFLKWRKKVLVCPTNPLLTSWLCLCRSRVSAGNCSKEEMNIEEKLKCSNSLIFTTSSHFQLCSIVEILLTSLLFF